MATTFIYALCEPGTRTVRYIGKTSNLKRRLKAHLKTSSTFSSHLGCWLRSLNSKPEMVFLREAVGEGSKEEIKYIDLARRMGMDLVNGSDGGEGVVNPSLETRAKLSARTRGEKNPMFGLTGEKSPFFGKKKSPEHRAKLSAANFGKRHTPESCAKMSAARSGEKNCRFGKKNSPELKAKLLAANLGKKDSLETRAKKSVARLGEKNPMFGKTHSEESKAKRRATIAAKKEITICAPIS